jgi:uncharacterized protein (TIGR03437 family)
VVAQFADGSYVLPPGAIAGLTSQRAKPGDTVVIYGIGFGSVDPNIPPGQLAEQLNTLASPFTVSFGTAPATPAYDGLAPNYVGLYQFNLVVPAVAASDTNAFHLQRGRRKWHSDALDCRRKLRLVAPTTRFDRRQLFL